MSKSRTQAFPYSPERPMTKRREKHLFAKPELYLSHMFGHEGQGSLHAAALEFFRARGSQDVLNQLRPQDLPRSS